MTKTLTLPVASIDLGHWQTKICAGRKPDGALHLSHFPSLAPRVERDYQAGAGPRLQGVEVVVDGVTYFVGVDALNVSGGQTARTIDSNYSNTPEYKALFLGALHHLACTALDSAKRGDCSALDIKTLVLGLPMNTLARHRIAVQTLAAGVHEFHATGAFAHGPLSVRVGRVLVVGQPMGALLAHSRLALNGEASTHRTMMVIDVGGGTVDWFVAHDRLPAMNRSGAYARGTLAQAMAVCERVNSEWRDDPLALAQIDEALQQDAKAVTVGSTVVDLKAHRHVVDSILHDTLKRVTDKARPISSIGYALVTGGGAKRMYQAVQTHLPDLAQAAHIDPDPVYSNVRGFYMFGEAANHGHV